MLTFYIELYKVVEIFVTKFPCEIAFSDIKGNKYEKSSIVFEQDTLYLRLNKKNVTLVLLGNMVKTDVIYLPSNFVHNDLEHYLDLAFK